MTKEEFLAMSLPHKLKVYVKYNHKPDNSELETMVGIVDDYIITDMHEEDMEPLSISNYGLCLHPLSDLTKEIEHKGEKFVPIDRFLEDIVREWNMCNINYPSDAKGLYGDIIKNITSCEFWIIQKLIEWHFNLMDKEEEFIDVNTLKINPYK